MSKPDAIRPLRGSKHVFGCIYGTSGSGKTRMLGESEDYRTLIVRPPTDHTDSVRKTKADEWVIDNWKEMWDVEDYQRSGEMSKEYDLLGFDSISLFQDHGVDEIFQYAVDRSPHRQHYGADKGEYGINMERLARWIRHVVGDDSIHFIYTAHPHPTEIASDTKDGPYVQGKGMTLKIAGYMNIIGYLQTVQQGEKRRRVLRFQETDEFLAKDQLDAFPKARLVDPTLDKFMAACLAAKAKKTRATRRTTTRTRTRRTRRGQ